MVGEAFAGINGFNRSNLVRLNSDGTLDAAFNAASIPGVKKIEVLNNGKYVVLVNTIVRLNNNGSTDTTFQAPSFGDSISTISAQSNGSVLVAGSFTAVISSVAQARLARLKPDGSVDLSFFPNNTFNGTVKALLRQTDEKIIIGGKFTLIGNTIRVGIARLNIAPIRNITYARKTKV